MDADAAIVHSIPGRVRLRVREKDRDSAYFSGLPEQLRHLDTVRNVKANPSTRSIVIEFSGTLENLVQQLQQHGLAVSSEHASNGEQPRLAPARTAVKPLNLVSGRNIDAMFMLGSMLAVIGIIQTFRGKISVPAITAFWYALNAYRQAGQAR